MIELYRAVALFVDGVSAAAVELDVVAVVMVVVVVGGGGAKDSADVAARVVGEGRRPVRIAGAVDEKVLRRAAVDRRRHVVVTATVQQVTTVAAARQRAVVGSRRRRVVLVTFAVDEIPAFRRRVVTAACVCTILQPINTARPMQLSKSCYTWSLL